VASDLAQSYDRFELILVDDQATQPHTLAALSEAGGDPRVKLIRQSVFQAEGGFDEVRFQIAFNNADLYLKIIRADYKIMYTPFAELVHHQSASRAE
jgi:hypothetical protein